MSIIFEVKRQKKIFRRKKNFDCKSPMKWPTYKYTKRFNYYYIIWFHSILFFTFVMIYDEWICYRQVVSTIRRTIYKMIQSHNYRITNTTFNCIWYVLCEIDDNFNKNVAYRMITFHKWHMLYITFKSMGVIWSICYYFRFGSYTIN